MAEKFRRNELNVIKIKIRMKSDNASCVEPSSLR